MNGVKRGLFSNEAGSGSAPCAAAAADVGHPAKAGLLQAFGVFIDTIVICSCTAMIMLLAPSDMLQGLEGMSLLQTAMQYHLGSFGTIFIAATLWLFSFSTFIGILFYARSNVAYLFGDNWVSQTSYKATGTGDAVHRRTGSLYLCVGTGRCGNRIDDDLQHGSNPETVRQGIQLPEGVREQ